MNKESARIEINRLASARTAFLFLADFELEDIQLWEADRIPDNLLFQIGTQSNYSSYKPPVAQLPLNGIKPFSRKKYNHAFERVKDEIAFGNSFLLNLTGKSRIYTPYSLQDLFFMSVSKYKLCYPDRFVFFSPETFLRIQDGLISSFPMKGTIDADLPNAEQIILDDIKETAEHNTIVDLIRNDMSRYARDVSVRRFRFIDKISTPEKNLLQVSSEITGKLPENYHDILGDILFSQLPAGSVSGAPKNKTLEIIRDVEDEPRGYYSGVAGFFDGNSLDSCVMIRFIENQNGKLYFRSGGGITCMSQVDKEYKELLQKIYVPVY